MHAAEPPLITRRAAELRALDERTANEPDLVVTEPEAAPRLPTGGPVATYATAGAAPMGGVDDVPDVLEDDTQLLKTGPAADATRRHPGRGAGPPSRRAGLGGRAGDAGPGGLRVLVRGARALSVRQPDRPDAEDVTLDEDLDEDLEPELEPEAQPAPESEPVAEDLAEDVVTEEAPKVDEPTSPAPAEPSDAEPADSTAPIKQARPRADRRRR